MFYYRTGHFERLYYFNPYMACGTDCPAAIGFSLAYFELLAPGLMVLAFVPYLVGNPQDAVAKSVKNVDSDVENQSLRSNEEIVEEDSKNQKADSYMAEATRKLHQ